MSDPQLDAGKPYGYVSVDGSTYQIGFILEEGGIQEIGSDDKLNQNKK